jgi:hypothetical protein
VKPPTAESEPGTAIHPEGASGRSEPGNVARGGRARSQGARPGSRRTAPGLPEKYDRKHDSCCRYEWNQAERQKTRESGALDGLANCIG